MLTFWTERVHVAPKQRLAETTFENILDHIVPPDEKPLQIAGHDQSVDDGAGRAG
jgi:hypothetical protein